MHSTSVEPGLGRPQGRTSLIRSAAIADIATDLTWVDMVKGIAIIGVFLDNWLGYFLIHNLVASTTSFLDPAYRILKTAVGPFVQVFFILSGFGLALNYLQRAGAGWSWKQWIERRFTKIILPYYLFVLVSFALGLVGSVLYETVDMPFSWASLFAYLTFTRNFYPPSWPWNPPLWYMPIIIGLYIIFPLCILLLKKWGPAKLLLTSIVITYASLITASVLGWAGDHAADVFLFWAFQFALGIVMAYVRINHPEKLRVLTGLPALVTGAALILVSWFLRTYIPAGNIFNDSLTSIGILLLLLNVGWGIRKIVPASNHWFGALSRQSYFMYLIHYPVMKFLIGPIFPAALHPVVILALGLLFILMMYLLCSSLSKPLKGLTTKRSAAGV